MSSELRVARVDWDDERELLQALREQVFILEQGVPREIEWDGRDADALHFLGTLDGKAVACGRLLRDGKVGRMAVSPPWRGNGFGRAVLDAIIAEAGTLGLAHLYLHAQAHAGGFYRKAGFEVRGEPFDEAGIPHIAMHLDLAPEQPDGFVTGVHYPQPFDRYAARLCGSALREICIQSPQLDHSVFEHEGLLAAISGLARGGRQTRVRILVADHRPLVQRGHRLLALARRIPSAVMIQRLAEHPDWNGETVIIRDRDGVLYKPGGSDHQGFYEPDSRASTRRHLELFEELWRLSSADANLRSLSI